MALGANAQGIEPLLKKCFEIVAGARFVEASAVMRDVDEPEAAASPAGAAACRRRPSLDTTASSEALEALPQPGRSASPLTETPNVFSTAWPQVVAIAGSSSSSSQMQK